MDEEIVKSRLLRMIPYWLRKKIEDIAQSTPPHDGKAENKSMEEILTICRQNWKKKQKLPDPKKEWTKCPSGKPDNECGCYPLTSPRSFPPSCERHTRISNETWRAVSTAAKEAQVTRGESNVAFGKWCQEHGICEMCWHTKDQNVFRRSFPDDTTPPSSRRSSPA